MSEICQGLLLERAMFQRGGRGAKERKKMKLNQHQKATFHLHIFLEKPLYIDHNLHFTENQFQNTYFA